MARYSGYSKLFYRRAATVLIIRGGFFSFSGLQFPKYDCENLVKSIVRVLITFSFCLIVANTIKAVPNPGAINWDALSPSAFVTSLYVGVLGRAPESAAVVICLGYPFHPPGKPDKLRTEHLETIPVPALIVQGERDPFGRPDEVKTYSLSKKVEVVWIPDGDHSLKPRKKSGRTEEDNLQLAMDAAVEFVG